MDKLSEHAIRMLEIVDKPYTNSYGMINKDLKDKYDIARAVYDVILQVQMLKTALLHKTEPNCSEKPNNCETCNHYKLTCDLFSEICKYEPKTEHSGEVTEMVEPQTEIRKDIPVICAECDHVSIHQKYLFCELSHRTVYNAKPEWCPLPKLFIADDESKTEPQVIACPIQEEDAEYARWLYETEPQTERNE